MHTMWPKVCGQLCKQTIYTLLVSLVGPNCSGLHRAMTSTQSWTGNCEPDLFTDHWGSCSCMGANILKPEKWRWWWQQIYEQVCKLSSPHTFGHVMWFLLCRDLQCLTSEDATSWQPVWRNSVATLSELRNRSSWNHFLSIAVQFALSKSLNVVQSTHPSSIIHPSSLQ